MELGQQETNTASTTAITDIAIKPENITYTVFVALDAEGNVQPKETVYTSSDKQIAFYENEVFKAGHPREGQKVYTKAKTQTVKIYRVGSIQGFIDLIGDEEEAVNIINKGLMQKTNQKVAEYLTAIDTSSKEAAFVNPETTEVYDVRELIQEPTQRRNLSPIDRLMKSAKAIPGFDMDKLREFLLAQSQA